MFENQLFCTSFTNLLVFNTCTVSSSNTAMTGQNYEAL
jgi:hypothetical protein